MNVMSSALRDEIHQMVNGLDESQLLELKRWVKSFQNGDGLSEAGHVEINRRLLQSEQDRLAGRYSDAFEFAEELSREYP